MERAAERIRGTATHLGANGLMTTAERRKACRHALGLQYNVHPGYYDAAAAIPAQFRAVPFSPMGALYPQALPFLKSAQHTGDEIPPWGFGEHFEHENQVRWNCPRHRLWVHTAVGVAAWNATWRGVAKCQAHQETQLGTQPGAHTGQAHRSRRTQPAPQESGRDRAQSAPACCPRHSRLPASEAGGAEGRNPGVYAGRHSRMAQAVFRQSFGCPR